MDLVDSHLDLTESCLNSSQFSDSTQLLESRLSANDMQQMEREHLLFKLLQLYQALNNTEKQNQLLRIQKAQLRTQLKNTKNKAKHFIQNNISASQSILNTPSERQQKLSQSPPRTTQNCFATPYDSTEDLENGQTANKVFIKSHKRGISNNCIVSDREIMVDPKTYCYTLMNSPTKQESINIDQSKPISRQKSGNKIAFPKQKLKALVAMEKEFEQANKEQENRTLENFESFYCHKKDDLGETQRWGSPQKHYLKPKSLAKNSYKSQNNNYNDQINFYNNHNNSINGHRIYQPFVKQTQYEHYEAQQSERDTEKYLNKSMSSSGLSNKNYCNSRGFKIPTSIDQIWGSSKNVSTNSNSNTNNKGTKLAKVNANKAGIQRKTYLNF